ncbi:MAG: membrane associated rhomboid family serine protease [Candidatus Azotimanducaceae bacterium]|jgi:membrane associated rhomboid family serine protease
MDWMKLDRYPDGHQQWSVLSGDNVFTESSKAEVRKLCLNWFPLSQKLFSSPGTTKYVPAICLPELADLIHQVFVSKFRVYIWLFSIALFLVVVLSVFYRDFLAFSHLLGSLVIVLSYCLFEYRLFVKPYARIRDHTLFYRWLKQKASEKKSQYILITILIFLPVFFQEIFYLQGYVLEDIVESYGLVYALANSGEWWRYLTGPFFHNNLLHWVGNFSLLLLAVVLVSPFSSVKIVPFFLVATIASAVPAQFSFWHEPVDGFVGISGGVFGLFGWATGNAYRQRALLPEYYSLHLALFVLASLLLPLMTDNEVSHRGHVAGFVLGLLFGYLGISEKPRNRLS